jgi:hypothetical protein
MPSGSCKDFGHMETSLRHALTVPQAASFPYLPEGPADELDWSLHCRYSWKPGSTAVSPPWVSSRASEGVPQGQPSEIPCASSLTCKVITHFTLPTDVHSK